MVENSCVDGVCTCSGLARAGEEPFKIINPAQGRVYYFGGDQLTLVEHPLSTIRLYAGKWIRDKIAVDQETLARLRLEEGVTNAQLAQRFGISLTSVKLKLYGLDRTGNKRK